MKSPLALLRGYLARRPVRWSFRARSEPKPKGSLRFGGKGVVFEDNRRTKTWMQVVSWAARAMGLKRITDEKAVGVSLVFFLPRPASHLNAAGEPNSLATEYPVRHGTGDLDKLLRAVLDALNRLAWDDDAQVVEIYARKIWANRDEEPGVAVTVEEVS